MRVKMTLSYDGSHFFGLQVQNSGVKTVMNTLYEIFHSLGIDTKIDASGRTDRGVHALRQVISFDLPEYWNDLDKLKRYINHKALPYVYIENIQKVDNNFHARYSAKKRAYRYIVSMEKPNVFLSSYVLYTKPFDPKKIINAISIFEGRHDFSFFMKSDSAVDNSVREIYQAKFYKHKNFYIFSFQANGFVRSQIRMMVSFLLHVGRDKYSKEDLKDQLNLKHRHVSDLVDPNGLYLSRIWYYGIPKNS